MDKISESIKRIAHGSKDSVVMMANQGASAFMSGASQFPAQNPVTKSGKKVIESMQSQYGEKKGKQVFYATMNKGKKGSGKWHK